MNYVLENLSDEGQIIIDLILILNGCDLNNLTERVLISEEVYNKSFKEKYSQYFIPYVSKAADSVPMPQDDALPGDAVGLDKPVSVGCTATRKDAAAASLDSAEINKMMLEALENAVALWSSFSTDASQTQWLDDARAATAAMQPKAEG